MKARNNDCVLRTDKEVNGCAALTDVHPDRSPECPFYKDKQMEQKSRKYCFERALMTGTGFIDKLQAGWDQ